MKRRALLIKHLDTSLSPWFNGKKSMLHKKYLINSVMNINNTEHYPVKILDKKKNSLYLYIRLRIY